MRSPQQEPPCRHPRLSPGGPLRGAGSGPLSPAVSSRWPLLPPRRLRGPPHPKHRQGKAPGGVNVPKATVGGCATSVTSVSGPPKPWPAGSGSFSHRPAQQRATQCGWVLRAGLQLREGKDRDSQRVLSRGSGRKSGPKRSPENSLGLALGGEESAFLWEARWLTPHRSHQPTAPFTHGSCSSSDLGCVPDPPLYTDLVKLPPQKGLLNHFQPLQRTPNCRNITP